MENMDLGVANENSLDVSVIAGSTLKGGAAKSVHTAPICITSAAGIVAEFDN